MNNELKAALKDCDTLNEMWTELNEVYNLDKRLGPITKAVVVNSFIKNLGGLIIATGTKERQE